MLLLYYWLTLCCTVALYEMYPGFYTLAMKLLSALHKLSDVLNICKPNFAFMLHVVFSTF